MFFFIGGVQHKTIDLDEKLRICSSCGFYEAHVKRVDHYISIFFLPVLRLKKGLPFLLCKKCGHLSVESEDAFLRFPGRKFPNICSYCGKNTDPGFNFCPFCDRSL